MKRITFFDTEINPQNNKIMDIGAIKDSDARFHSPSIPDFLNFLQHSEYICGHNIIKHDLQYLSPKFEKANFQCPKVIDTLLLSPLLYPAKLYHNLLKDDKLQTEELNNPLNDSIKAKDLFYLEKSEFNKKDELLKSIFYSLLFKIPGFCHFFNYIDYKTTATETLNNLIFRRFKSEICEHADIDNFILHFPVELAYCLALIDCKDRYSVIPPWVLKNFPEVEQIMYQLRNKPCITGCVFCDKALDIRKGLRKYFGYQSYRTYNGQPLQENAVRASIENKSILAIFPTGGGKSITFQVPALMSGENVKGLTVVISPLQSLMKDQVDNLLKKDITEAVTINGLLDPIERAKSFEKVEDGSASLLYISPESLRSKTIERLLLGRKIVRFVIDEAHCFSSWGQDFRVDYLYIGDFICSLQKQKNLTDPIPVSCFTATAKQKVIEDITSYFRDKLGLNLEIFRSSVSRTNLHYKVLKQDNKEDKYNTLRNLIEERQCPTIVYVSRTSGAEKIAYRLSKDGFQAQAFHGKMDSSKKIEIQNGFIAGNTQIMVATSAFGMGVDKDNVGLVVHYEISDSLENYIQEAGRAGRNEQITASCYILFDEEDLSKHFILLNQTKIHLKEIQQIWKAIKEITRFRSSVSQSALEIARKAGWDDSVSDIETRVTTAIAALEDAGYLKRGQNMPRIFANSILSKTAQEAIDRINSSNRFSEKQRINAVRIIKKLFSVKSRKQATDEIAESRVDYISDHLGIVKEQVIEIITLLREEKILADAKDLTAFIKKGENKNRSIEIVRIFNQLDNFLCSVFEEQETVFHLKALQQQAEEKYSFNFSPDKLKTLINFWVIKNWIKRRYKDDSRLHISVNCIEPKQSIKKKIEQRHELSEFIINYLFEKTSTNENKENQGEVWVEFSVLELKEAYEKQTALFKIDLSLENIEDTLFYLSRIGALKIEGGFLVVYNRLTLERLETNNKIQYKQDDYQKLEQYYDNKVQQIHIVGEYAQKMTENYLSALQFVEDYFQLNYSSFLQKYFPGSRRDEIRKKMTPAKFKQLFGSLSTSQLNIINDTQSGHIVVAAGPGSGKTKLLVHKLASLLLMEDVKHEQLLMLTFSRAAAGEFRRRLYELIGNAIGFIEIKTFHSYCFDLLGRMGTLEKAGSIVSDAVEKIQSGEVEINRITKTVLVIDEAQDMTKDEFALITALMEKNGEEMKVIAVGDDDQNIFTFRGSDSKYLRILINQYNARSYELLENYRSKRNIVDFANQFVRQIHQRLKEEQIIPVKQEDGRIKIVRYVSDHLVEPVINDVLASPLSGSTCIMTKTNDEAMQIHCLLQRKGITAKLIQENSGFSLKNIREIHFFTNELNLNLADYIIDDEQWEKAKLATKNQFKGSTTWDVCYNIIKTFEKTNTKKYKTDWDDFLYESRMEDFYTGSNDIIFVSTIHKSKGKEFDNVFLILNGIDILSDENKREIYVAVTRAKNNLSIHLNGNYLDSISTKDLLKINDLSGYSLPPYLSMILTHKDIWLDYSGTNSKQLHIISLKGGDLLQITENGCTDKSGVEILRFSNKFKDVLLKQREKGYKPEMAKVNFIVYWEKKEEKTTCMIVLPELILSLDK